MNELAADFWNRVNTILKEQRKTQVEMCRACEIPLASFRNKISVQSAPNVFDAYKIAKFLDTTVEFLITGSETDVQKELLKDKISRIMAICNE